MPPIDSPEALQILDCLIKGGGEARFVGGCVRDYLVQRPFTDIDIATTHTPEKVQELLEEQGIHVVPTGIKHGTVTAVIDKKPFEITTLRKDISCDGRHAEVEYTDSWEEDAARRDFTMNAMSMDRDRKLYDYFGGKNDLECCIVRFVGAPMLRIQEDYLRILRMFRFHAYYGEGVIIEEQLRACAACAAGVDTLSGERIQQEMLKILSASDPYYVLQEMNRIGVLHSIFPGLSHPLTFDILDGLVELKISINALTKLSSILINNDINKDNFGAISQRWVLSNDDKKHLSRTVFPEAEIDAGSDEMQQKRAIRVLGKSIFHEVVQLAWAKEGAAVNATFEAMLELSERWTPPKLPIRGVDLLKMGVEEGKEVGRLLKKAEDYWEENEYIPTRDELLELVKQG